MRDSPRFRNEALAVALDAAIVGEGKSHLPLFDLLGRNSGLPGPRANMGVVAAFAGECAVRGARADKLIVMMATLDADRAPGGTELEILPMCGISAIGERAATEPKAHRRMMQLLHECADDLRFRVRDCIPVALARIGQVRGDAFVAELAGWTNGFFHAAYVLIAMSDPLFMPEINDSAQAVARLDEAFQLAKGATRSTERYPGYKSLIDALSTAPGALATRFGVPVFDALVAWSTVKEPLLRAAIEKNLTLTRLTGRQAAEIARVRKALDASAPLRRDPLTYVGKTRGRGKKGNTILRKR